MVFIVPSSVEVKTVPSGMSVTTGLNGKKRLYAKGRINVPHDIWFRQIGLGLPEKATEPILLEGRIENVTGDTLSRNQTEILLKSPRELARSITIEESHLPTDEAGNTDLRRVADTLILPGGPGEFILSLLGRSRPPINPYIPYRHQTLWLRNRSNAAISLVATSEVLALDTKRPVPFLQAPDLISGGTGQSVAFANLPPGEVTPIILPVFMDSRNAKPGTYLRRVRFHLWGTNSEILRTDLPIHLRRPSLRAFIVTMVSLFTSLIAVLFLIGLSGRFFRNLPVRLLSGAATFASAMFVLSTVPDLIAGSLIKAVLGPFSFLIDGVFTELTVYALGAVYLMRYPMPGALTLLILIRSIILSLTLYSVQLVSLLMIGVEILILEGVVWLAGITRGDPGNKLFERWPENKWRAVLIGGVAFVSADLLITGASFHLHIFFYRLVYADWYIVLYLAVTSILFTFLGTALGLRIGAPLQEIAG